MPIADKWERRYQQANLPVDACALLQQQQARLPTSGRALDLACGLGGNAVLLARHGLAVDAVDKAATAIRKLSEYAAQQQLPVNALCIDLECTTSRWLLEQHSRYDVIVVSYYLHRPILPLIEAALAPGGLLFYQTFNSLRASPSGPQNPDFLLTQNELADRFSSLSTRLHRQDINAEETTKPLQTQYIGQRDA